MSAGAIVFVASAVVLPLLLAEFGDWCPWLANRLTRWSAKRLGDAQAAQRYSEEWLAELSHLPGKLSHLLTAFSYLLALPRIRWTLRAARRTVPTGPDLDELLPNRIPLHWTPRAMSISYAHQVEACYMLLRAILDVDPRVRNRLHFLVGPVGCGKTTAAYWLYENLLKQGKKVHYVWAPAWAHQGSPTFVGAQMRDRLALATQEVGLLVVDEADQFTINVLHDLQLPCPVLVLARSHGQLGQVEQLPTSTGTVVDMGTLLDSWRQATPGVR